MTEYRDETPMEKGVFYDIQTLGKFIREKKNGKDTREAMAQGIERANLTAQEALEAQAYDGNSLADVILAKDGEATLHSRLVRDYEDLDAKKANLEDIGAPTQSQVDDWLDRNPEATTTVADDSITTDKLAKNSVTFDKIANIELLSGYMKSSDEPDILGVFGMNGYDIELSEEGTVFNTTGNLIDLLGYANGVYTNSELTITVTNGNHFKLEGTTTTNLYFPLIDNPVVSPTYGHLQLDVPNYTFPKSNIYSIGIYNKNGVDIQNLSFQIRSQDGTSLSSIYYNSGGTGVKISDITKMGKFYLFIPAGNTYNHEFDLSVWADKAQEIHSLVAPNTDIHTEITSSRFKSKGYLGSDVDGVAHLLVPIAQVGTHQFDLSNQLYIESTNDLLNIYKKGSNPKSNKWLRMGFKRFINAESNADGWGIQLVDAMSRSSGGAFTFLHPVALSGEWEMAIRLEDRPDFIGLIAHGSEIMSYIKFYKDGVSFVPKKEEFYCKELKVIQKTTLYDPNDEVTIVGYHLKEYIWTVDELIVKHRINWLDTYPIDTSYLTMMTMARGNDAVTDVQVTDTMYDETNFEEHDVSVGGFNTYPNLRNDKGDIIHLYGSQSGVSASAQQIRDVGQINSFVQNTVNSYNKIYFIMPEDEVTPNEPTISTSVYKLDINS